MNINFDNNIPIYIQIVEKLKMDIISGKLVPGDRLPSVRDLAFNLKVNPNTLVKALNELESLNLIYTERTNGKYVTSDITLINKIKDSLAHTISSNYLKNMADIGYNMEDTITYLKENK